MNSVYGVCTEGEGDRIGVSVKMTEAGRIPS